MDVKVIHVGSSHGIVLRLGVTALCDIDYDDVLDLDLTKPDERGSWTITLRPKVVRKR